MVDYVDDFHIETSITNSDLFFHYFLTRYNSYICSDLREGIYTWIHISMLSSKSHGNFSDRRLEKKKISLHLDESS